LIFSIFIFFSIEHLVALPVWVLGLSWIHEKIRVAEATLIG